MRSILVTIDDTPSAVAARTLAVALARRCGATIRGVTALDVSDLHRVVPVPIGGVQHAYDRLQHRETLTEERRARIAELPAEFRRCLADAGMEASCLTLKADVRNELLRMIETCDLVVTGRDAEFHLELHAGVTPLVEHMIVKGSRPVMVSGSENIAAGPVLVAYDGSAPAAKALQMAVLLGIFGSSEARVLSIARDHSAAAAVAGRARAYLELHGVAANSEAVESSDHPADVLLKRVVEIGARLLVMGAFGHRGEVREILFGSSTRRLFDQVPVPLFVHH